MTAPPAPEKPGATTASPWRRIAVFATIAVLLFVVLWYAVFSAVTAALIAVGGTGVLVVGSSVSETLESLLEMLANAILAILAAIAAFFAAIFSVFD